MDFRHALLEPEGPERIVVPEQQMSVFVEYRLEGKGVGQWQDDQILVASSMEESRQTGRFALALRKERTHAGLVRKREHNDGRRSNGLSPGQYGVGLAKLF